MLICAICFAFWAMERLADKEQEKTRCDLLVAWRGIQPGEHISIVSERLGPPGYTNLATERAFSSLACASEEYCRTRNLYRYPIGRWGPYHLDVFTDTNGFVTFVTATPR